MKRKLCYLLTVLMWAMLAWGLLWNAFRAVAFDAGLYYELQVEAGVLETAGIDAANLEHLDYRLAEYLQDPDASEYLLTILTDEHPGYMLAFNEREITHLQDCRRLIQGFERANLFAIGIMIVFWILLSWIGRGEKELPFSKECAALWLGFLLPLAPIAVLGLWAAIDFQSAFTFFHKLLFTNDLWLLDPATDLLIRICPQSMFVGLGWRIGVQALLRLLGIPALVTLGLWLYDRYKRRRAA